MKTNTQQIIFIVISTLLLIGCTSVPIRNVSDVPFARWESDNVTQKEITKAIMNAGTSLGWVMSEKEEGHIQGRLHLRTHIALVDIHYDDKKFSITYNDSTNLDYDGTNIHRQYNSWIKNLTNRINLLVAQL